MIYTEVSPESGVRVVKALTKIGRILRSEHEKKSNAALLFPFRVISLTLFMF